MMPDVTHLTANDPMKEPVLIAYGEGSLTREGLIEAIDVATSGVDAAVQGFDPRAVFDASHLEAAARRALRSHVQERGIARDVSVEMALYAAGTTQIDDALARVGVPKTSQSVVLAAVGPDREKAVGDVLGSLGLERGSFGGGGVEALGRVGIGEGVIEQAGEDEWALLVLEHVALLDAR